MSRIRSQISYYDLTGGLNNVNTPDTLNSSPRKTESPDMVNVEFFKLGGIKSMDGNMLVGDKQESPVVGGWEYSKGENKYLIIALQNGEIKMLDNITNTFVKLYQFEHQSDRVSFCNMNNGFVATNGIDDLMFYERGRHQALSGTVAIADGDTEITGTHTAFTSQLNPGDQIEINNAFGKYTVDTVASDTRITITPAISTHYDTVYYQFYDANNAVSIYSKSEVPQEGSTLYFIDTETDPYTITTAGTVVISFDPENNNMAYRDTNNVLQSARRPAIHTDLTVTTTLGPYDSENIYLSEISPCNATLINTDTEPPDNWQDKPIRGLAIQFYAGRLWVGGADGLFYSQLGQYNKWDVHYDAGELPEVYNDTSEVKALGLYSDFMLVHKEFNTYLLTLTGKANGSDSTLSVKPYSNVSCDSQQSWVVSNTKYYVYSNENMDIFPLSQRTIFSDRYLGDAITNKVRNVFHNLRSADVAKIFCATLPRKRWMLFYLPMIDQLGSAYCLIFDFQTKSFIVRKVPEIVTIAFNFMNEVYIGTENGLVLREFIGHSFVTDAEYNEETGAWDSITEPIIAYYKSPWFDWAGDYFHSFAEFAIDMAAENKNNFYIRTFKDGDSPYEDRIIDDNAINNHGLIWDGGEYIPTFNYIFKSNPMTIYNFVDDEDNQYYIYTNNPTVGDWIYEIDGNNKVAVGSIDKIEAIDGVNYYQLIKYNLDTNIDEPFLSVHRPSEPVDIVEYINISNIPNTDPEATEDTTTYIDENVYITSKKNGDDLEIYKVNPSSLEEVLLLTISDYYVTGRDVYLNGHDDNNLTQWDKDVWASGSFNSIRMLLPNNVFETFQLEIGTNQEGQAFAIYGYNFRRLETEEAPW